MRAGSYKKINQTDTNEEIPLETIRSQGSESLTQSEPQDDEDDGNESDSSATSQLFADINDYSRSTAGEESFEDDAGFQKQWYRFKMGAGAGKIQVVVVFAFCVLIWMVFLIVYSNGNASKKAASLWHGSDTNIVELSHRNVSLNSFDPNKKNVSFEDYRKASYVPSFSPIRWLDKTQFPESHDKSAKGYHATRKGEKLVVISADSNYEKTILDSSQFSYGNKFYYAQDVILNPGFPIDNPDAVHLLRSDSVSQWRHSEFSLFWLWTPVTGEVFPIQPPSHTESSQLEKLHFAKFDPTGKMLVFGFDHDLYLLNISTREISAITTTGSPDIFNGKPDWVYEEEVYPHDHLVWWSPDSKHLVYAVINDTNVESYNLDYYVKGSGEVAMKYGDLESAGDTSELNQYPKHTFVKYPKPGTVNPSVKVFDYSLKQNSSQEIKGLSDATVNQDFILYDAVWVDGTSLLLKISDRYSSVLEKKVFNPEKSLDAELVSIQNASDYNGWIEKVSPVTLVKRNNSVHYLDRVVVDGLVQLALFESAFSEKYTKLLGPVSYGSALSYDVLEDCVYGIFGTNLESSFASVSLRDGNKTVIMEDGALGLNFSPNGQFLELVYGGPHQPWQKIINMAFVAEHEDYVSDVEPIKNSDRLSAVLESTNLPSRILSSVKVGRDSENVNMIEIFPPNFKRGDKHPLLVHVYGGPGSTTVNKEFNVDFQDIVRSQLDAVVLIIDPRGTGSDDWRIKSHSKGNMGLIEPQDIVAITKDYVKANSYIDDQKTAIWGWSYGGFTTLKTLEYDKGNVFKYGVAVAPVTNWLFYDSVFTERIMGSPKENPNYKTISRINEFGVFKDVNRFLIMQGTADDNVHMQNSLWLMDKFDKHGVENYDVHFFPDSDHSIRYHNANNIVYDKLFWWLEKAYAGVFV
ncbi:hypothetical protein JCM33374_g1450 [Metschnikowia sp. JCM 33374]|nr:hypothetical protein JCM33374_g1450 [Metschnikowia sp. JCM 33374]